MSGEGASPRSGSLLRFKSTYRPAWLTIRSKLCLNQNDTTGPTKPKHNLGDPRPVAQLPTISRVNAGNTPRLSGLPGAAAGWTDGG